MTSPLRRHPRGRPPHPDVLTPAEWRVLEEIRQGRSNPEIAERLGLSRNTVKTHISTMLSKLDLRDRDQLAAWRGEPALAQPRRSLLLAPFGWLTSKVAGAAMATAVTILSLGALVVALESGRSTADHPGSPPVAQSTTDVPSEPTASPTAGIPLEGSGVDGSPLLSVAQVTGSRGCDQPLYVRASGLPPLTEVQVELLGTPDAILQGTTTDAGFLDVRLDEVPAVGCGVGSNYGFRIVEVGSSMELAATEFAIPVLEGRIEIEPASGGCEQITVSFHDFPPDARVAVIASDPSPFAHSGFSVVFPRPVTNGDGFAETEPFSPPWMCDVPALSLSAFTDDGADTQVGAELLYRIALSPDEPIPGIE